MGRTDNGLDLGRLDAVDKITGGQHMGGRYGSSSQFVQGNHRKPIAVVPFQHQHHPVTPLDSGLGKHICHLIAVSADLVKGKDMFFIFRIAPNHGPFGRCFLGNGIHNIIAKVKIIRIVQR